MDGGAEVAVSRRLPEGVPASLQRFLPADGRVLQTDVWQPVGPDGVRRGSWRLEASGAPARMTGQLRLEPSGTGCRHVVEGTVEVSVPLVGRRLETYRADLADRLLEQEGALLAEPLAEPPGEH